MAAIVLVPGVDRPRAPRVTEMPVRPRMRMVMNQAAVAVSDVGHPGQIVPKVARVVAPSHRGRGDLALGNIVGTIFHFAAFIAGVIALVQPLELDAATRHLHLPVALATTPLLCGWIVQISGIAMCLCTDVAISAPAILGNGRSGEPAAQREPGPNRPARSARS